MEVILKKNVDNLGYTNDLVTVKNGYGRNFLIPQGNAVLATASVKKAHAEIMKQKSHKDSKILAEAQELATKLEATTVKIVTKAGEKGKIFGSVNTVQLSEALKAEGALGVPAAKVGGAIIERSWACDILPLVIIMFIFEGIL